MDDGGERVIFSKIEIVFKVILEITRLLLKVDFLFRERMIRRIIHIAAVNLKFSIINPLYLFLDLIVVQYVLGEQSLEVSQQLLVLEVGIMLELPLLILDSVSLVVIAMLIDVHFVLYELDRGDFVFRVLFLSHFKAVLERLVLIEVEKVTE